MVDVVHTGQLRNEARDAIVWSSDAAQQVKNRERHRHCYPVRHIEDQHRGRGGQRQEQLAAPEPGDPAEFRVVDQPKCSEHHEGTGGGQWKGGERRTQNSIVSSSTAAVTREYT
jgi:hypothetical protein